MSRWFNLITAQYSWWLWTHLSCGGAGYFWPCSCCCYYAQITLISLPTSKQIWYTNKQNLREKSEKRNLLVQEQVIYMFSICWYFLTCNSHFFTIKAPLVCASFTKTDTRSSALFPAPQITCWLAAPCGILIDCKFVPEIMLVSGEQLIIHRGTGPWSEMAWNKMSLLCHDFACSNGQKM